MNIMYISHESYLNGAPKSLLEYLIDIKEKGVNPVVIIPQKGPLKRELDKYKIENFTVYFERNCINGGEYKLIDFIRYLQTNYKAIIEIRKIIKKKKIDIVHSNSIVVDVGAVAAWSLNIPHIWHLREYVEEDFNCTFFYPNFIRVLLKKSKQLIAISDGVRKKYKEKYGVYPIKMINGIDEKLYYCPISGKEVFEKEIKLLIAGVVSEGKGQWDAIRATEILVNQGKRVHLYIVGRATSKFANDLKRYVKNNNLKKYISFMDYTNKLQEIRCQSNIILVCSRMEGFGRVTAEAMIAGKTVIGTNSGGTVELMGKKEERGYLYSFNNPEELANKIVYVIENQQEALEKRIIAQKYAMRITNKHIYTKKLIDIYRCVLDNKLRK